MPPSAAPRVAALLSRKDWIQLAKAKRPAATRMSFFKALGGCIDKTFIYLWGLLGLKFVRGWQIPTEQREVGICHPLYLSAGVMP